MTTSKHYRIEQKFKISKQINDLTVSKMPTHEDDKRVIRKNGCFIFFQPLTKQVLAADASKSKEPADYNVRQQRKMKDKN